jgi:hypothetical protein
MIKADIWEHSDGSQKFCVVLSTNGQTYGWWTNRGFVNYRNHNRVETCKKEDFNSFREAKGALSKLFKITKSIKPTSMWANPWHKMTLEMNVRFD